MAVSAATAALSGSQLAAARSPSNSGITWINNATGQQTVYGLGHRSGGTSSISGSSYPVSFDGLPMMERQYGLPFYTPGGVVNTGPWSQMFGENAMR